MIFQKTILMSAIAMYYAGQAMAAEQVGTYGVPPGTFPWKSEYPVTGSAPVPKPEWLAAIKDDPILQVPLNTLTPDKLIQNADPTGANTYCNWTWDGCVRPTDIVSCEDNTIWGTSFDDGPYMITKELLAYLKSIDVKVTFFVVGIQVLLYPEVMKQAFDEGHEIGIHTWDHKELTTLTNEQIVGELKWTETAIKEVLGVTPRLVRPPRGDIDDRVRYIVQSLGYTPAMWSVDTQDWRINAGLLTTEGLLEEVKVWANAINTLTRGHNSLMHDLSDATVKASIAALNILDPLTQLTTVGNCAGWNNESYFEYAELNQANGVPNTTPGANKANVNAGNGAGMLKVSTALAVTSALAVFVSNFF